MRGALTIAWRDFRSAFDAPPTYFFLAFFLLASGLLFVNRLLAFSDLSDAVREAAAQDPSLLEQVSLDVFVVQQLLAWLILLLMVIVPLLTMKLLAEEKRTGTMELLLTSPVSPAGLVAGKFLGGLLLVVTAIGLTLWFPAVLIIVGRPDPGPLFAGYLGLILAAAVFTAVGLLTSALTDSPLLAAFLCFVLLLLSTFAGIFSDQSSLAGADLLGRLSVLRNLRPLTRGVVDTGSVATLLLGTLAVLFVTHRVLESRRWR